MIIKKYNNIKEFPPSFVADIDKKEKNLFWKVKWFDLLQKHTVNDGEEVVYYCVLDDNKTIEAIFPLIKPLKEARGGYKLKSLANFYTMEYEPFFAKRARNCRKAISVFVEYLAIEERNWSHLEFFPVDEGKLSNIYLKQELSKYFTIISSLCHKNWIYYNNGEAYQDYLAYSPSRIKDISRKERRLAKKHDVQFRMWSGDTDIEKCITDYFSVYNNSWKDEEQYPGFIPDLIRQCAGDKTLRLGILYVDNMPSAAQLNIFHDNITLIYKLSYHEKYKHLSAGAILSFKMMEYAFDQDKSRVIDYGSGDDPYKKEWMNICREKMIVSVYNTNLQGKFLFYKSSWKARIKQLIAPEKGREI